MLRRSFARRGLWDKITSKVDEVGTFYKPKRMTSKDILWAPTKPTNQAYDPVDNARKIQEITGPLRRKSSAKLDNYVDIHEVEKWMEVKDAAKILKILEVDLPTLTREKLEIKWATAYKEQSFAHQQETILAMEVMLEFLDSKMYIKKSREFYRDYVDNARVQIDHDTKQRREVWKGNMLILGGIMAFGGCCLVMVAAMLNGSVNRSQLVQFGGSAQAYLGSATSQPTNLEPAPDYSIRYLITPSSLELDEQNNDVEKRLVNPAMASIMTQDEEYRAQEDALTIRLLNVENDRIRREQRERELMESTRVILRQEDLDKQKGTTTTPPTAVTVSSSAEEPFAPLTLGTFMTMAHHQFGGSKSQRFASNVSKHAAEEAVKEQKLRMLDPRDLIDGSYYNSNNTAASQTKEN